MTDAAPFTFSCHRCGHCCSVASGFIWITEEEIPGLARARQMSVEAFRRMHVRLVGDRLSLTEKDGRCSLLEAPNHCTVYAERPQHCREFPYWPDIVAGGEALERAREMCPGIQVFPERDAVAGAFRELEQLYREVDADLDSRKPVCIQRGVCCHFPSAGHEVYCSLLEADFAASRDGAMPPALPGLCPFHIEGRCENREGRPLGCRTYFCDPTFKGQGEEVYARWNSGIKEICSRNRYPWGYGKYLELLKGRQDRIRTLMA